MGRGPVDDHVQHEPPQDGYPFASTVDFATDADGFPIFCLTRSPSPRRTSRATARASLTTNEWLKLANAGVTIFDDVHRLPDEYQGAANEVFKAKYEARKEEVDLEDRWGDYTFYRMNNIIDVYFVGGFGTLNWVNLDEYKNAESGQDRHAVGGVVRAGHSRRAQHQVRRQAGDVPEARSRAASVPTSPS